MNLKEWINNLKQSSLKFIDLQNNDPDRVCDLMLAAAIAVAVTSYTFSCYYGGGFPLQ